MDKSVAVLYIEDHMINRKVMEHLLTNRLGLENVVIYEDSTDILARAEALDPTPKLIMLDIHIPPHNGFEVLEILRNSSTFDDSLIIAITASVMNEEIALLKTSGFDGCLSKPIDADLFEDVLKRILAGEAVWHIFR